MLIITLFSYACQAFIFDFPWLPEFVICPMLPPAAKVYEMILLDSFVLKNPSEVIDLSFLVMTPLKYGSVTSFLAVNLAAGLTTSIFCVKSLAS